MKTIDVSQNVMKKVVRLEKGRTKRWFICFIAVVFILILLFLFFMIRGAQIISDRQGWDLLILFRQDPEIITSYWRDTLWIFWEEAPQRIIFLSIVVLVVIIGIIVWTRRKRKVLHKKLRQLEKYG